MSPFKEREFHFFFSFLEGITALEGETFKLQKGEIVILQLQKTFKSKEN